MRIGLYGGAFDPIHVAHLIIAQYIKDELFLDKVIFIPSAIPPHKSVFANAKQRYTMVELALAEVPYFESSKVEIERQGVSYSVDTISFFKDNLALGQQELFWIMGSDNFIKFDEWKNPAQILSLCQIVVFPRNTEDFEKLSTPHKSKVIYIKSAPVMGISSTTVRKFLASGKSIKYLVPSKVYSFIRMNKLYS